MSNDLTKSRTKVIKENGKAVANITGPAKDGNGRSYVSVYSVSLGKTERYFQSFDWLDKFMDYAEDMSDLRILKRMPENFTMSSVGTFDGGYAGASRPTATVDERPITKGKRVSVVDPRSPYGGFEGEVTGLEGNGIVIITLDTGAMIGVFLSQVTVKA